MNFFRPRKPTPETILKKSCIQYLKARFGSDIWEFSVRGGIGQRAGVPDLIACIGEKFYGIEFKAGKKGRLSENQKYELEAITKAGGVAIVIRSLDECIEFFKQIPLGQKELF